MKGIHILIDGQNTAIRTNAVMDVQTKQGERTAAIFGTLNTVHNVLEHLTERLDLPVKEVILFWDRGKSPRRRQLFPDYKVKKKEWTPEDKEWMEDLFSQIDVLHNNVKYFGIKSFYKPGWEGDDLIFGATEIIHSWYPEDLCIILSTDEDYYQLICNYISVFSPIRKILYSVKNTKNLIGMDIQDYILYKSLKGDTSDGIPGIHGIGEKTAKALVNKYHTLEGLIEHKEELMTRKITSRIFTDDGLEVIRRNNALMNLRDFVDLSYVESDLKELIKSVPVVTNDLARKFLMRWQFATLIVKYTEWIVPFEDVTRNFQQDI